MKIPLGKGPQNIIYFAVKWVLARIRKEARAAGKIIGALAVDTAEATKAAIKGAEQEAKRLEGQAQALADSAAIAAKDAEKVGQ